MGNGVATELCTRAKIATNTTDEKRIFGKVGRVGGCGREARDGLRTASKVGEETKGERTR